MTFSDFVPQSGGLGAVYTVDSTVAQPGPLVLSLSQDTGTASSTVDVTASATAPQIDSIVPDAWPTGMTTSVTISGSGFGGVGSGSAQGAVTLVPQTYPVSFSYSSWSDSTIVLLVTPNSNDTGQTVSVSVTGGTYGSGFLPAYTAGQSSASSSAVTTPTFCSAAQIDQLRAEYRQYVVNYVPGCLDFIDIPLLPSVPVFNVPATSESVPYAYLNWSTYDWAIVVPTLEAGLNAILAQTPVSFSALGITSAYRNPYKQIVTLHGPADRHIHGDAADLDTHRNDDDWDALFGVINSMNFTNAVTKVPIVACIEPFPTSTNSHVHVELRQDGSTCSSGWAQSPLRVE